MAGTMTISKKLLDRLRAAFKRYGSQVLGDPSIAIDFFPTEFEEFFGVLLTSPKFQNMTFSEQQNSVWNYLRRDPDMTNADLFYISEIATESEAVEFI